MFKKKKKIEMIQLKEVTPPKTVLEYKMSFTYEFVGADGRDYMILWKNEPKNELEIRIFDVEKQKRLLGHLYSTAITKKYGELEENNNIQEEYWKLEEINVENYKRIGLGTALMKAYFEIIIFLYPKTNINIIKGIVNPKGELKNAVKFYKTFDNYITSTQNLVEMHYEHENKNFTYTLKE